MVFRLNGVVPLAFSLQAANSSVLHIKNSVLGIILPSQKAILHDIVADQAHRYVTYILDHQTLTGWIGPDDIKNGDEYWSRFPVLLALAAYAEANPANKTQVAAQMYYFVTQVAW